MRLDETCKTEKVDRTHKAEKRRRWLVFASVDVKWSAFFTFIDF